MVGGACSEISTLLWRSKVRDEIFIIKAIIIMLNLIVFGAPGSGKGTQGTALAKHYDIEHISTGDLLRGEISRGTPLGKEVDKLISNGQLVPDEMIIELLRERLNALSSRKGIILDGFPRTVPQAEALFTVLEDKEDDHTLLIDLKVEEEELVSRLLNRGKISGRSDDNETAIVERLKVYHESTEPVIDYFKKNGQYIEIQGIGDVDEITERIVIGIAEALSASA